MPKPAAGATGALAGSDFVRLLARWSEAGATPDGVAAFGERLSGWFAWTDAIALSSVLSPALASTLVSTLPFGPAAPVPAGLWTVAERLAIEERELDRVRQALRSQFAGEPTPARGRGGARTSAVPPREQAQRAAVAPEADGFAPHRRRYLAAQKAMEQAIAPLRQRLREAVAAASPALTPLAMLDGVMADVLGARERALLAQVPALLAQRYQRLQAEATDDLNLRFQRELQQLLEAELDLRLQPVEGLLDALRQAAAH